MNSPRNPPDFAVRPNDPKIEATWREYNGNDYLFVLNLSNSTLTGQQIAVAGMSDTSLNVLGETRDAEQLTNGNLTDSFAPYQMHIYTTDFSAVVNGVGLPPGTDPGGVNIQPIPEPASLLAVAGLGMLSLRRRRPTIRCSA